MICSIACADRSSSNSSSDVLFLARVVKLPAHKCWDRTCSRLCLCLRFRLCQTGVKLAQQFVKYASSCSRKTTLRFPLLPLEAGTKIVENGNGKCCAVRCQQPAARAGSALFCGIASECGQHMKRLSAVFFWRHVSLIMNRIEIRANIPPAKRDQDYYLTYCRILGKNRKFIR